MEGFFPRTDKMLAMKTSMTMPRAPRFSAMCACTRACAILVTGNASAQTLPLATMKLFKSTTSDLAGGIYSYLDNNNNNNRLVLVNAKGELERISYAQQSGTWSLTVDSSVSIGYPDVVGLVPDYQGRVWFATAQGTSGTSGAVVGYYDPTSSQTSAFTLPAGEQVANSISSSPTGVAVASTSALYLFQSGASGPEQVWREVYDRGPARKPGQLSWGTGATPVFFGPTTGYEYLTITDNAYP